jgi:hypothetical protein
VLQIQQEPMNPRRGHCFKISDWLLALLSSAASTTFVRIYESAGCPSTTSDVERELLGVLVTICD